MISSKSYSPQSGNMIFALFGAVAFLADWTNKDPVMTEALHRYKRGAVPLVLVYPPKGEAIVLPPVMSGPEKVLEALGKAVTH